jgi:hypothetical protein
VREEREIKNEDGSVVIRFGSYKVIREQGLMVFRVVKNFRIRDTMSLALFIIQWRYAGWCSTDACNSPTAAMQVVGATLSYTSPWVAHSSTAVP